MRLWSLAVGLVVVAVVAQPVGAVSKKKQCTQRCAGLTARCAGTTTALGFGNLGRSCKKSVLKRCLSQGVAACDCGDGTAAGSEACDGSDLKGATCQSLHFGAGTLACTADCHLDTTGCGLPSACGNGAREGTEECDGGDLGGATCASRGFAGGTLACAGDCSFDTAGCTAVPATLPVDLAGGGPTWWHQIGASGFAVNDGYIGLPKDREDAYDDFWAFTVDANGYSPTAAAARPADFGTTIIGDVASLSGLNVTQAYTALTDSPTLRVLISLANPTGAPITASVVVSGNLGSDGDTTIEASSDGDTTFTAADRWLITSDGPVTASDPINTFVFFGPGASVPPTTVSLVIDEISVTFPVTVPAGATQNLLFFSRLAQTASDAEAAVPAFDTVAAAEAAGFFRGLSGADRTATVNWSLPAS